MKKNHSLITTVVVFIAFSVVVISCSKQRREFRKEDGQVSFDNKEIQSSIDDVTNEANRIMSDNNLMSGKGNEIEQAFAYNTCGYTVDTTQRPQGILLINFDGTTNCNGRIRAGQVRLTLQNYTNGARWRDTNAVLKVEYINYKVTRVSDNKSLTFNGTKNITNVSGGNVALLILGFQNNLVHRVTGNNIQVKFDDGKIATFNLARKWTHTWANNVYTVKIEGEGSRNGRNNLENWGITRNGDNFTSQVLEPVNWNSTCGAHKPVSGKLDIVVDAKDFSFLTTFGVDNSGNVVSGSCPWGFKVEWIYKNKTGSKLYPYN